MAGIQRRVSSIGPAPPHIFLRKLPGEVREKVEESFRNAAALAIIGAPPNQAAVFLTLYSGCSAIAHSDSWCRVTSVRSSLFCRLLKGGRVRNELLAVAGASHTFVVVSKSLNQCACRTWREESAANWRNYQASNQRVRIGDRLYNIR